MKSDKLLLNLNNYIFKSNNNVLIKISKKNLNLNKISFDKYIDSLIKNDYELNNSKYDDELSELSNIDWLFLNSIYVAIYSNFENHISNIAKFIENYSNTKIKINDIKGEGHIDKFRKYINLIGNIQSAEKNEMWKEIDIYRLVRNKLVHNGGYLISNRKSKLENHQYYDFLIENKVILAGSKGNIRIREIFFLEKFSNSISKLSDLILQDIKINIFDK